MKTNLSPTILSGVLALGIFGAPFVAFLTLQTFARYDYFHRPGETEQKEAKTPAPKSETKDDLKSAEENSATPANSATTPGAAGPSRSSQRKPESSEVPWYQDEESKPFITLSRLALFSATAFFGALGATLSIMTRKGIPLSGTVSPTQILSSQIVGAVFSCVLAFFFAGGLIAGALFPRGDLGGGWFVIIYHATEFFKLLVWSFLGGFSERMAPDVFATFSNRIQQETQRGSSTESERTEPPGSGTSG